MGEADLSGSDPPSTTGSVVIKVLLFIIGLFLLSQILLGTPGTGITKVYQYVWTRASHTLPFCLIQYANDLDGKYPTGKSSVEICQKLLDGKYVTDPNIFYIPMKGKTRPVAGQPLKPENVCWDFTVHSDGSGLDSSDPDTIPVVFVTGYKVSYVAGGSATPIIKPYPEFFFYDDAWSQWWRGKRSTAHGLGVCYKSKSAKLIALDSEGIVPKVVPLNFDTQGKSYRQLTPDGALP